MGYSRRLVKTCGSLKHIGPMVAVAQWLTALLVVVMMLQHYTRVVPFPEGAPAHSADLACRPDQLQCPRRMGLVDNISRNRRLSNGADWPAVSPRGERASSEAQPRALDQAS